MEDAARVQNLPADLSTARTLITWYARPSERIGRFALVGALGIPRVTLCLSLAMLVFGSEL